MDEQKEPRASTCWSNYKNKYYRASSTQVPPQSSTKIIPEEPSKAQAYKIVPGKTSTKQLAKYLGGFTMDI